MVSETNPGGGASRWRSPRRICNRRGPTHSRSGAICEVTGRTEPQTGKVSSAASPHMNTGVQAGRRGAQCRVSRLRTTHGHRTSILGVHGIVGWAAQTGRSGQCKGTPRGGRVEQVDLCYASSRLNTVGNRYKQRSALRASAQRSAMIDDR